MADRGEARPHPLEVRLDGLQRELETRKAASGVLEALWTRASVGLATLDAELRFVRVNDAFARLVDRTLEACIGRPLGTVLPSLAPELQPALDAVLATGGELSGRVVRVPSLGAWWDLDAVAVPLDGRRFVGLLVRDVTPLHSAAEDLRLISEVNRRVTAALEVGGALEALLDGCVPRLADVGVAFLVEGREVRRRVVAGSDPALREAFQAYPLEVSAEHGLARALRTGTTEWVDEVSSWLESLGRLAPPEAALLRSQGMRSWLAVPLVARDRILGGFVLATKAPRALEPARRPAVDELGLVAAIAVNNARLLETTRAAVRLRDEFISVTSHELRTPLTTLRLRLESAARAAIGLDPEGRLSINVRKAAAQASRLAELIDQLLDVTRLSTGDLLLDPEEADLAAIAREALEAIQPAAAELGCTIELGGEASLPAHVDPARIRQVLRNLLTNALRYGGGCPVQVRVLREGSLAKLEVQDTGEGLATRDLERIFRRFGPEERVPAGGGLGLGLYVARRIVEAHGGRLRAVSPKDAGTTFIVELPLEDQRSAVTKA